MESGDPFTAGAGLGGLSLARALETLDTGVEEITVFERRSELRPDIGGGVQLSGGAAVLTKLGLLQDLKAIANPLTGVVSRTANRDQLLKLDVPGAVQRRADAREALFSEAENEPTIYAVMRDAVQLMLKSSLSKAQLKLGKEIASVANKADGTVTLAFADGTEESGFDLVVGADGIRADTLRAAAGTSAPRIFSGKRILFGVAPASVRPPEDQQEFHQWFSKGVYGLVATYGGRGGGRSDMIAFVYRGEESDENADWNSNDAQKEILRRLEEAGMPEDMKRVAAAAERFFDIGVYFHLPRFSWTLGNVKQVVLLGDSAHAMPPFLGQGANQAIQDAYCLASQLAKLHAGERESLGEALEKYEERRKPPTIELLAKSVFLGELETLPGDLSQVRNGLFFVLGKLGIAERVFIDGCLPRT
eukprot:gnl/TRDRNA2_/TRDRNA2_136344_c0_seq2.p1 gnl/TRDRNA2_/TRDRNA2_136344_c0~~gnl/TRDRNA2_/TRDRNA2_136344_c0_seq2.p1  ORF type:complete len:419 (-),score=81.24 gnl/TRDRNA2_/TRDRNA2_136344_c0_seq2:34-1290(-)